MERKATCACGQVSVVASGEPDIVSMCYCTECQKRTGSAFGVTAYFKKDAVGDIAGESGSYTRTAESGRVISYRFCPEGGTSVCWHPDMLPDHVGIAVGCFADPDFPAPQRAVWTSRKPDWASVPDGLPEHPQAP